MGVSTRRTARPPAAASRRARPPPPLHSAPAAVPAPASQCARRRQALGQGLAELRVRLGPVAHPHAPQLGRTPARAMVQVLGMFRPTHTRRSSAAVQLL